LACLRGPCLTHGALRLVLPSESQNFRRGKLSPPLRIQ
jgi:hypothetical protein